MADSRNILTRLLGSETGGSMPYVLGTAGAVVGGGLLYYYLVQKPKPGVVQRVGFSPASGNVVAEESFVHTAVAEAKGNTVTGGNLDNRAIGPQAKSSATDNTVTNGDLANNPIQYSGVQTPEMLQAVLQQTAPKPRVPSNNQRGDGGEEQPQLPSAAASRRP